MAACASALQQGGFILTRWSTLAIVPVVSHANQTSMSDVTNILTAIEQGVRKAADWKKKLAEFDKSDAEKKLPAP